VEEAPVVTVPVIAPDTWLPDTEPQDAAPAPARFLSEDEETEEDEAGSEESAIFAASAPVAASADVAGRKMEQEPIAVPSRPQFAEMAEEPASLHRTRDYASDFNNTARVPAEAEAPGNQPQTPLFSETGEAAQPDLDVPAFMRGVQF